MDMRPQVKAEPYDWPHDGTFNPQTTALVIIDMQMDCKHILFSVHSHIVSAFHRPLRHVFSTPMYSVSVVV
jgi:hypothetical protein